MFPLCLSFRQLDAQLGAVNQLLTGAWNVCCVASTSSGNMVPRVSHSVLIITRRVEITTPVLHIWALRLMEVGMCLEAPAGKRQVQDSNPSLSGSKAHTLH